MNIEQIAIIIGLVFSFGSQFWQFFKLLQKVDQKVDIVVFNELKFQVNQLMKDQTETKTSINSILTKMEDMKLQLQNISIQYQHLTEILIELRHERNIN